MTRKSRTLVAPRLPGQLDTLLGQLRSLIRVARDQAFRAVDEAQVTLCWEIGRHILEFEQGGADRAGYGEKLLPNLAKRLSAEFGKGFDASNLRHMRAFYVAFPIRDALRRELSWTHYRSLLRVEAEPARVWYMNEAAQQRLSTETKDFYLDLVFYNYLLKCFVLFDLKTGELTHQDIGQMDMYVRMYDELRRAPDDNPTVGIILCAQKDASVVRYSVLQSHEKLFASKYRLVLPSEEELRKELDRERELLETAMSSARKTGGPRRGPRR